MSGVASLEINREASFSLWSRARSIAVNVGRLLYPSVKGSTAVAFPFGGSVARQSMFPTSGIARC